MWSGFTGVINIITSAGLVLMLFAPGVLCAQLLFPKEILSWRLSIGLGLGVVLIGFFSLLLGSTSAGISHASIMVLVISSCAILAALIARSSKLGDDRLDSLWKTVRANGKDYMPIGFGAVVLVLFVVAIPMLTSIQRESYTQFYIVDGYFDDAQPLWRRDIKQSEMVGLTFTVQSNELTSATYSARLSSQGETLEDIDLGVIAPGEIIQRTISIPPRALLVQQYDLTLYRDGADAPYRALFFSIHAQ
jgi:Protein of unknown function (DUF1616)